jgi:hypothetical protein
MILPSKHINLSNCVLNISAILLSRLTIPTTVTSLWDETRFIPEIMTFDRFIVGLDLLYLLGLIDFSNGLLMRLDK